MTVISWALDGQARLTREVPMDTKDKRLLDVEDQARMLNISERGLYRLARSGEIPFHRVGGQLRFDPDEVLEATRGKPTSA